METPAINTLSCPVCHNKVQPTDYFCSNCGKNLKPAPPSTSLTTQLSIYLGSIFLPPMGIIWGVRYLRFSEPKSKMVGWIAIILTIISLIVSVWLTIDFINQINAQIDQQMKMLPSY